MEKSDEPEMIEWESTIDGARYKEVKGEWKKWRDAAKKDEDILLKWTGHYASGLFRWHAKGKIAITCEYLREQHPDYNDRERTREFKVHYRGPKEHPVLEVLKELFTPPPTPVEERVKEIEKEWNWKIKLEKDKGAPSGLINMMKKNRDELIAKAQAEAS